MIGKGRLRDAVQAVEGRDGAPACQGDFILAIQRELSGSVSVSLQPEELTTVLGLMDGEDSNDAPDEPTQVAAVA